MNRLILSFLYLLLFTAAGAQTGDLEYGKCGYYSDNLQGRKTASGEKYNKTALTCAHKSLPFGTQVRITRLDNNKSVVVRVNDRGPYSQGYIVDVSRKAAETLGLIKIGVARVSLEVVDEVAGTGARTAPRVYSEEEPYYINEEGERTVLLKRHSDAPPARYSSAGSGATARGLQQPRAANSELYGIDVVRPAKRGFGIQLATLFELNNVMPEVAKAANKYPGKIMLNIEEDGTGRTAYKILIGPFSTRTAAETQVKQVAKNGYAKCFVVDLSELP